MASISDKLRIFREKNKFTQEYLAYRLNICQQAYQKIESGKTKIDYQRLIEIANIYNIPPHEFIGDQDNQIRLIFEEKELIIIQLKLENEKLKEKILILSKNL